MTGQKERAYRAQVRSKGRLTLPGEIRSLLRLEEGDDLIFTVEESGRVLVQRLPVIDPEQAWFWSERWQAMEREAQADIEEGRITRFNNVDDAVAALEKL
jgi:antitoxin PrlF